MGGTGWRTKGNALSRNLGALYAIRGFLYRLDGIGRQCACLFCRECRVRSIFCTCCLEIGLVDAYTPGRGSIFEVGRFEGEGDSE